MFRGLEERAAGKEDPTNPGGGVGATLVYLTSTLAADPDAARLLRYDAANLCVLPEPVRPRGCGLRVGGRLSPAVWVTAWLCACCAGAALRRALRIRS